MARPGHQRYNLLFQPVTDNVLHSMYCVYTVKSTNAVIGTFIIQLILLLKTYPQKLTVYHNCFPLLSVIAFFPYCLTNSKNSQPETVKSTVTTQLFFPSYFDLFGQYASFLLTKTMDVTEKSIMYFYTDYIKYVKIRLS